MKASGFDRCNLERLELDAVRAHGGEGLIGFCRIVSRHDIAGRCNFIDYTVLPPGASVGEHRHATDEEEFYLVLSGEGSMWRDGDEFIVRSGDLIRNPPGGAHRLVNCGSAPLRIFVFELSAEP